MKKYLVIQTNTQTIYLKKCSKGTNTTVCLERVEIGDILTDFSDNFPNLGDQIHVVRLYQILI